jgi:F-type H+-transporting ATPase subunit b
MIASLFLVPNDTFFVELAVVLVLVFLFYKYILPPLNRVLSARQEQIRGAIEAAEQAKKEAEAADDERLHVLDEARGQAREIVASAQQTAEQVRTDATERAQAEYERIVSAAAADVQAARERAVEEAASRLGEIVIEVVTKIVGREIDANAHRELINEAIAALNEETQKGAGQTI